MFPSFYFLFGHLLAHPATHAPKMRAVKDGQTSMHTSRAPPGQRPSGAAERDREKEEEEEAGKAGVTGWGLEKLPPPPLLLEPNLLLLLLLPPPLLKRLPCCCCCCCCFLLLLPSTLLNPGCTSRLFWLCCWRCLNWFLPLFLPLLLSRAGLGAEVKPVCLAGWMTAGRDLLLLPPPTPLGLAGAAGCLGKLLLLLKLTPPPWFLRAGAAGAAGATNLPPPPPPLPPAVRPPCPLLSAVLFLGPPKGPGHGSQPSRVSLTSPSQVG